MRTAAAIAERSGPSVTLAFIVAGVGCAFAGLCYAEFASMIPIAGSAYTYSYATMGELVAWIIGWDLILEYAVGAATVAIAWSEYFNKVLEYVGLHDAVSMVPLAARGVAGRRARHHEHPRHLHPAAADRCCSIRGTQESAMVNSIIVITKVAIVAAGDRASAGASSTRRTTRRTFPPPTTYTTPQGVTHPYGGIMGILGAAGVVFFAFIGFDAVSTAAQEAKNPKRDMPIGILGSLVICTVLYVLFSHVLSGVATVEDFRTAGKEASVAFAITKYMTGYEWLAKFVTVAILAGFSSVILVMLLGPVARVLLDEPRRPGAEGLLRTCTRSTRRRGSRTCCSSSSRRPVRRLHPGDIVGEMTSIGTLFAFMLVCAGVWIMRVRRPDIARGFTVPALPVVAVLGIVVCGVDDLRAGLDQLAAAGRVAGDRPGVLLRVRHQAQPLLAERTPAKPRR